MTESANTKLTTAASLRGATSKFLFEGNVFSAEANSSFE